jgi:hypothetical protein
MERYQREVVRLDFGDDDMNPVWWEAEVTFDTRYREIISTFVTSVHIGGKKVPLKDVDSDLQNKIEQRMMSLEYSEI